MSEVPINREKRVRHNKITYVELAASDLEKTKTFYNRVFGWNFNDYGPEYTAFEGRSVDCGFFKSDAVSTTKNGAALVVLYSEALEETEKKVVNAGGALTKEIFSFPGGRRFQFTDPNGNELAVWSDAE